MYEGDECILRTFFLLKFDPYFSKKSFMLKVGLTGGIGSGKTTVAQIFKVLGVPVYNSDEEAKRLMDEDGNLKSQIRKAFGEESYSEGKLDRKYLASQVFNNSGKIELLNSFVHPATIEDAAEWMKRQKSPYIIKEAALIFESGSDRFLDKVIGVSAPLDLRISRTMKRNGISKEEVLNRMELQMDEAEKLSRCDYIIFNDEEQMLIPQVLSLHERFLNNTQ